MWWYMGPIGGWAMGAAPPSKPPQPEGSNTHIREQAAGVGLCLSSSASKDSEAARAGTTAFPAVAPSDPLLEFLEKNEEDAAVLLAMWTSLRRSCLYASEISETLSLRVRYCFHSLIERRAIAAALGLYERLVYLGLQLRQSDIMLLLANLPYEYSAATQRRRNEWVEEEKRTEKTRSARKRRQEGEALEVRKTMERRRRAEFPTSSPHSSNQKREEDQECTLPTSSVPTSGPGARKGYGQVGQPTWVKNWILYEVSIGNLDYADEGIIVAPATPPGEPSLALGNSRETVSDTAKALLQLNALLQHLHLLQVAYTKRQQWLDKALTETQIPRKMSIRVRVAPLTDSSRYGMEALRLLRRFLCDNVSQGDLSGSVRVLPRELSASIRALVRHSNDWKVALAFAGAVPGNSLSSDDAILFLRLAAPKAPWRMRRDVESLVAEKLMCLVPRETAVGYAVEALWLAHLCEVKSERPEALWSMVKQMKGDATEDAMDIASMIERVRTAARLATSVLVVEVQRSEKQQKAEAVLATSIRTGAFECGRVDGQHSNVLKVFHAEDSIPEDGALWSPRLQDSLDLCATATVEAVRLSMATALRKGAAVVSLHELLESAVYGPFSIWSAFSQAYVANACHDDLHAIAAAPERGEMAATVATMLLRVVSTVCSGGRDTGVSLQQVRLLLEIAVTATEGLPTETSTDAVSPTLKDKMTLFQDAVVSAVKPFLTFHRLAASSDRVVFGAVSDETVQALQLLSHLILKGDSLNGPLRHSFLRRVAPSAQRTLKMCLNQHSAIGKQVRRRLSRKDATHLNRLFKYTSKDVSVIGSAASVAAQRRLTEVVTLREMVYSALLNRDVIVETPAAPADTVLRTIVQNSSWQDSLAVLHLLTKDMRAARHTVSVNFFADVLDSISRSVVSTGRRASFQDRNFSGGKLGCGASWLDAVGVFWTAVDHTSRSPVRSATTEGRTRHEKKVLDTLLLPLLCYCESVGRRDLGRQWRRTWEKQHSREERREPSWKLKNIRALSTLNDSGALQQCRVLLGPPPAVSEDDASPATQLLCDVSVSQSHWVTGLRALMDHFGSIESHVEPKAPYPIHAVRSILELLARSPTNLSNTALRLRDIQGDVWDMKCTLTLLRMLLQARRWRLTLQIHALEKPPRTYDLSSQLASPRKPIAAADVEWAQILVAGLRGCAIGGVGNRAATLYDQFQEILHYFDVLPRRTPIVGTPEGVSAEEDALTATLGRASQFTVSSPENEHSVDPLVAELRALSMDARNFFFRAMTKKMMYAKEEK